MSIARGSTFSFWASSDPLGLFKGTSFRNWGQTLSLRTKTYKNCEFPTKFALLIIQLNIICVSFFFYWSVLSIISMCEGLRFSFSRAQCLCDNHELTQWPDFKWLIQQTSFTATKLIWEILRGMLTEIICSVNEHSHPWLMLFISLTQCRWLWRQENSLILSQEPLGCFLLSAFSHYFWDMHERASR